MSGTPWLKISAAEDPFAPIFLTVAELTDRIKRSLENDFSEVALHGEISNVTRPRSGHLYFTIKDDSASIRAVIWKNDARRITFDLADGLSVRALGRVIGLSAARRVSDRRPASRARGDRRARAGVSPALRPASARRAV